ncbi:hypothetical protein V6Z11_D06G134100 [Gossypium hirsutum]
MPPQRQATLDAGVEPLMKAMIRAFQRISGGNFSPVSYGLPLECFRALGGKEFRGVKGADPTVVEYWLEGVVRILEQMSCSNEEKLGCTISLSNGEAHHWWNTVKR